MSKGPWKTLEQRQNEALERRNRQERREAERAARLEEKYQERIEQTREKEAREKRALRRQIQELEWLTGAARRLVFILWPEREAVRAYRHRQQWSVRMMARECRVASRQITMLESTVETIRISEGAMNRIRKKIGLPMTSPLPSGDPVVRKPIQDTIARHIVLDGRPDYRLETTAEERWPPRVVPSMELRKALMKYRKKNNVSQKTFAKICQVNKATIAKLEDLEYRGMWVYISTLNRILKACQLPPVRMIPPGVPAASKALAPAPDPGGPSIAVQLARLSPGVVSEEYVEMTAAVDGRPGPVIEYEEEG